MANFFASGSEEEAKELSLRLVGPSILFGRVEERTIPTMTRTPAKPAAPARRGMAKVFLRDSFSSSPMLSRKQETTATMRARKMRMR